MMDRLTIPDVRVDEHTTRRSVIDVEAVREHAMKIYWRLKAYEDTGLDPEKISWLKETVEMAFADDPSMAERMHELAVADKEGRVIVLPCKVGEPAYWVHNGIITDCRINRIQTNRKGVFLCLKSTNKAHGAFRVDVCLGETVFLTREEAEKALQEMEE